MERRIRAHDWSRTSLGPLADWPQSLKTALKIALNSRYPIWMGWGWDLINLYNDPYIPVLGKKHELALGVSAREVWKEIWEAHLGPQADRVLLKGEASWNDQRQLVMYRNGYAEETYFTFSFSPLPADDGGIGGLFCACTEETEKVLGERRLATLRHLAAATADARTERGACGVAADVLSQHGGDISFGLIYLMDQTDTAARLVAATTPDAQGAAWAPALIALTADSEDNGSWPLARSLAEGPHVIREIPPERRLPGGSWPEPASVAAVVPLGRAGHDGTRGFLVVGASPRLPFDEKYQAFFELLARGIADALSNSRAYEEEKRRAEILADLDRAKTAFFSNVSHEFRTPLTLMLGPIEDLLDRSRTDLTPSATAQLEIVHRNSLRLLKLVNTMLDFSRIEAGRVTATYEPVDLPALTADLASSFRSACERAGLRLIIDCPSAPFPQPAYVDRDMWEKIVLNLISNAFKYTLEGEIEVRVDTPDQRTVRLTVRDTGVGIPAEELPRMFERFHRVQNVNARTHEGTGIGLALVQELVRLHGGTVSVESALGEGSRFVLTLPLGRAHLDPARVKPAAGEPSSSTAARVFVEEALRWLPGSPSTGEQAWMPSGRYSEPSAPGVAPDGIGDRPRVLWADDNADMRDYVARLLGERFDVESVADGLQALAAARRNPPELVLTDVMMPQLDGFGLLRELRQDVALRDVPVIMLSARAGEESRIEGMEAGADDYLTKPFSARELLARVEAHVRMARLRRETEHIRRQSEQELRHHAARFETLVNQAPIGVYLVDADFRLAEVNPVALPVFGDIPGGVIGRDFEEVMHILWEQDYADEIVRIFRQTLASGESYDMHERAERRLDRGVIEYYEWRIDRITLPNGRHGLVCYFRDIGAQVEARRVIEESRDRLREADRRKDEFLAILAHELRNPLAPIRTGLELLRLHEEKPGGIDNVRAMLDRQVAHMVRLIDDLLDVSRITSGRIHLECTPTLISELVQRAVEANRGAIDAAGLGLVLELPNAPYLVDADPTRFVQVVSNLLNNAAKFTKRGGRITVRVAVEEGAARPYLTVTVRDTGVGIAPEMLPRVFDLFVQADGSNRGNTGLGIGLALARQLIELHGGSIHAHSDGPGLGSAFTVTMPIATSNALLSSDPVSSYRKPGTILRRVLIIDDNVDAADTLAALVEALGGQAQTANDGQAGVSASREFRPDVVLLDIGMPGIDGYETLRRLRRDSVAQSAYIVALTGWGQDHEKRRALGAGFDAHLTKPADPRMLQELLAKIPADRLDVQRVDPPREHA